MKKILSILKSGTIKDSFIVSIGLGGSAVIGFIYTILLARSLGPVNFGVYSALTALAAIVYSLGDMGISSAIINFLPKKDSDRYRYLSTSFWIQFAIGCLILFLFIVGSAIHEYIVPGSLKTDLLLAGALSFNYLLIVYTQGIFTAERRFWSYSASQIIDSVVKIIIVLVIFRMGNLSIGSAITANIISTLVALFATFGKDLNTIEFNFFKGEFWKIFNFSKWIAVSRVFTVMISRIDILLLNLLAGSYVTGIYSAASRVSILFAMMASGLNSVINPRLSSFDNHKKTFEYTKKLLWLVTGIAVVMVTTSFFAQPIIFLVYGQKYLESVNVFRYLILAMIPFLYSVVTNSVLIYSLNQLNFYTILMVIQTTSIVLIDIVLIPVLGYNAPAVALFLSNMIVLIAGSLKIRSQLGK